MKIINSFFIWQAIIIGTLVFSGIIFDTMIADNIKNNSIERTKIIYSNIIIQNAIERLSDENFHPDNHMENKVDFISFFNELKNPEIVGLKIWSNDSTILFSNNEELIGLKISENTHYQNAINGEIITIIRDYDEREKLTVRDIDQIMEIYVPIYYHNVIEGVIEVYIDPVFLNDSISKTNNAVFTLTGVIITIIGIITVINFRINKNKIIDPIKEIEKITEQVSMGNFDVTIKQNGNDEIVNLGISINKMLKSLKKSRLEILTEQAKFRNLYEDSPSLLQTINKEGIILDCNKSYFEMLGYDTKNELIGTNMLDSIAEKSKTKMEKLFKQWRDTGKNENYEFWFKKRDGSTFPTMISTRNLYDKNHKLIGRNNTIQDISDVYLAMQSRAENDSLEIKMNYLKKIEEQKDEFAAMISHELKSPLMPIIGYCELLKEPELSMNFTDLHHEAIDEISLNAERLNKITTDLLDINKLHMKKFSFKKEKFSLSNFISNIEREYSFIMTKKQIQFIVNSVDDQTLYSDESRLRQVIDNLLLNAMDFVSKITGKITFGISSNFENIIFSIHDNGIGISEKNQKELFKKFFQIDTSIDRNHGGTGLGLVICKGIVDELGGKMWVESKIGKGSTFYFQIPKQNTEKNVATNVTNKKDVNLD